MNNRVTILFISIFFIILSCSKSETQTLSETSSETLAKPNNQYTRELKLQDDRLNGEDVKLMQERLYYLGYSEVGDMDGWYGPNTKKAVDHFQKDYMLYETGIINEELWDSIFSDEIKKLIPAFSETRKIENKIKSANEVKHSFEKSGKGGPGYNIGFDLSGYKIEGKIRKLIIKIIGDARGTIFDIYYKNGKRVLINWKEWEYDWDSESQVVYPGIMYLYNNSELIGISDYETGLITCEEPEIENSLDIEGYYDLFDECYEKINTINK